MAERADELDREAMHTDKKRRALFDEALRCGGRLEPPIDTEVFYRRSVEKSFVKVEDIARNIEWITVTDWGELEITVNLSKPEKDPKAIAAAAAAEKAAIDKEAAEKAAAEKEAAESEAASGAKSIQGLSDERVRTKQCALCVMPSDFESGYARLIELGGEPWGFWYSPYAYFDEHCIAMSWEHRPMHIDRAAFEGLFDFVGLFPHYFIGSNADLPIVGGSILVHDHYQGGLHRFPMHKAPVDRAFALAGFPDVECGVVRWPLTVLRLEAQDRGDLVEAACSILDAWRGYTNEELGIIAETREGGVVASHNTITPMLRREGERYILDLALRCNITSEEHPLGVFHPHAHLHHVKKENIGLIEVMGRAILPARLTREMDVDDPLVRDEIGRVFAEVLECCGVFKWNQPGQAALDEFLAEL